MSRLIDADILLDILDLMIVGHKSAGDVYDVVDSMPTVDAVEVVRCKDCKHYKGLAECYVIGDCMGTNGYCAWGERREER